MFKREYSRIFEGDEHWKKMSSPSGPIFEWDDSSTYVKEPPYFENFGPQPAALGDVENARVLALLGTRESKVARTNVKLCFPELGPEAAGDFLRETAGWVRSGQLKYREDIVDGLENAPTAFMGLLKGKNFGKQLVRVAE